MFCGNSKGKPHGAIDEQIGESSRQDCRLLSTAIVVVLEIDGFFVDITHHLHRQWCHFGFCVSRGGGTVIAGRSEVSLTQRKRVSQAPRLYETNESVVDGRVTVWVKLPHDIADHPGAFGIRLVWAVPTVIHCVEHAPMHRF